MKYLYFNHLFHLIQLSSYYHFNSNYPLIIISTRIQFKNMHELVQLSCSVFEIQAAFHTWSTRLYLDCPGLRGRSPTCCSPAEVWAQVTWPGCSGGLQREQSQPAALAASPPPVASTGLCF